jgi:hypothetical protein
MKSSTEKTHPPTESEVAVVAYSFWEEEGRPDGRDMVHWLRAVAHVCTNEAHAEEHSNR